MAANNLNPTLENLKELIGIWEMELSNASFLSDPKTVIKGIARFEWFEGGDFLIFRQGIKGKDTHWATWLIGHDNDSENYTVLYFDDQKSSRIYEMSYQKDIWRLWRNAPDFLQRFTGIIDCDKKMITGTWEKCIDGKTWSHDFDLKYRKTTEGEQIR